jgi:hypothetical protein
MSDRTKEMVWVTSMPVVRHSTRTAAASAARGLGPFLWRTSAACAGIYVVGVPVLRSCATAVTSCAGANGFSSMMLLGTPLEVQSAALAPLI